MNDGYNKESHFGSEFYSDAAIVDSDPIDIGTGVFRGWAVLTAVQAGTFTFRTQDGATTLFQVKVPAGGVVFIPGFESGPDLEILVE